MISNGEETKKILVTGAAGFVGYHLCQALLKAGHQVVGLDNLNEYYSVSLKEDRLQRLEMTSHFRFVKADIRDERSLRRIFADQFNIVVHLAAYSGVRHSIKFPDLYIDNNIRGFLNVIEACRQTGVEHFVFASSSSVYGQNPAKAMCRISDADVAAGPVTPYALTKRVNEQLASNYSRLFKLKCTGIRLFSVYGPWGRPDMAYYAFTRAITEDQPIQLFNGGNNERDFTYIDDVRDIVMMLLFDTDNRQRKAASAHRSVACHSADHYRVINIGSGRPIKITALVSALQEQLQTKNVRITYMPEVESEALYTCADMSDASALVGQRRFIPFEQGIRLFVDWYVKYAQQSSIVACP